MMKILNLSNNQLISKGGERSCFQHPFYEDKIIKIEHESAINKQNDLEYTYYKYLKKNNVSFSGISNCFGWCKTNKGIGLIFEKVQDYNFKISKSFRYYLRENLLSEETENKLLNKLQTYLYDNKILFIDVSTVNILCKEVSPNRYKLVIIDGLGGRRLNYKFYFYMYIPFITKYKIKKQWKKFFFNYKRDKNLSK